MATEVQPFSEPGLVEAGAINDVGVVFWRRCPQRRRSRILPLRACQRPAHAPEHESQRQDDDDGEDHHLPGDGD
eukprot:10139043-Heterocapsa_arctica.AAC.1